MTESEYVIKYIEENLKIQFRTDLKGNVHLCLVLNDKVISNVLFNQNTNNGI